MASLIKLGKGKQPPRAVDVNTPNGRKRIRLGVVTHAAAKEAQGAIERLANAATLNQSPDNHTTTWLAGVSDEIHARIARAGLCEPRQPADVAPALKSFIGAYIDGRRPNLKPNTIRNLETDGRRMVEFFGADRELSSITPGEGDDFREWLLSKYAPATTGRTIKRARQFFKAAARRHYIGENPFAEVEAPAQANAKREYFVSLSETQCVLESCPDAQWRLIVALSRYGGLRCPSEHLALTWDCVDWERERLRVPSPKTEHHAGRDHRIIPLWPELREALEAVYFDPATDGQTHIIYRYRQPNANLRTQLLRIVKRAGLKAWPRLFHNLRASRETELTESHPLHVVCYWLGNSAEVASRHYLQVTEDHYASALKSAQQKAQQNGPASGGAQQKAQHENQPGEGAKKAENPAKPVVCGAMLGTDQYPLGEANNLENSAGKAAIENGAQQKAQQIGHLQRLIDSWPRLSEQQRERILAIVDGR